KDKKEKSSTIMAMFNKVKEREIAVFCRQFSTMIGAGVSVADALEDLSQAVDNPRLRSILKKVLDDVRAGSSLSEGFSRHKSTFSSVFVYMIGAGEESGNLANVLKDLSNYLEKNVKLKGQMRSASMYPLFIFGFFLLIIVGLVFFLIPQFKNLFESLGADLPVPTQIVMSISEFMVGNALFFIAGIIFFALGISFFYKTDKGKYFVDSFKLKFPIFGELVLKVILARFFQTLATLLNSGVDVVASLDIASKVSYNSRIERIVEKVKLGVVEGGSLSSELRKSGLFPRLTVSMTAVGEKSGSIGEMLNKISDYYTDEVDSAVEGFSSLIEPVMIISLGVVVGLFVVTMYLPIFRMAAAVMAGG
ncbi:MAG: type II secretion system F family protein, partial [Elusimicrobiota bacterium]